MTPSRSASSSSGGHVAVLELKAFTEALERWASEPTPARRADLRSAFERLIRGAALGGGRLRVDSPPIPPVEVSAGGSAGIEAAAGSSWAELRSGDRSHGSLVLEAGVGGPLVEEVVGGLAMAVEAARNGTVAGMASDELAALDASTRAIAAVLDLDRVLQLITDRARELAHAEYGALAILDQDGTTERFISSGLSRIERERIGALPRGLGLLGIIARESRPIRIHDIETDPRRAGFPPDHPHMHSLLGVPVAVKSRSMGRLYLANKLPSGDFTAEDERLVEMFALHAGIAIDNARLHEQVQRLAVVEERERIGRDLHDGIIQSIYAVGLSLEDIPDLMHDEPEVAKARVERAVESLDQSIRDIRNFIFGLRPELLEQAGLIGGLAALADEFRVNSMVDIDLETDEADDREMDVGVIEQLLSIAREALSNIARHSKATRGRMGTRIEQNRLRLIITDNGVGFDPAAPRSAGHQGLVNMRDRAASLGGILEVDSEPGVGTRIIVDMPLPEHPRPGAADRGDE
jgi:signal transduction histidine kinase